MADMFPSTSDERVANNTMRHQYRVLSEEEKAHMLRIKDDGARLLSSITDGVRPSRERSLAITKVEEAVMWAIKGLTSDG
jgi:hypothetical protein